MKRALARFVVREDGPAYRTMHHGFGTPMASPPTPRPARYWNERRRQFTAQADATKYRFVHTAQAAIARHHLDNCHVVTV